MENDPSIVSHIVSAALTDEYMDKFWRAPGTLTPFITESFQWRAAKGLIAQGYRDYELAFGETFSTRTRVRQSRGRIAGGAMASGYWYIQVTTPVEKKVLARRRAWRKIVPYKWYKRIPWRIMDPDGAKWYDYLRPSRWMKIPRIEWEAE